MSTNVNDRTLILSTEDIAGDIVTADDPQDVSIHDVECALVTADNINNDNQRSKDDPDYEAPKFDDIRDFLGNEEGLDIYQLVAFRIKSGRGCCTSKRGKDEDEEECGSIMGYWMDIIKAFICCFAQFSSIIVLYFYTATMKEESEKSWCDQESTDSSSKLMAISYAFFLSLVFHLIIQNQKIGFYSSIDCDGNDHNFISSDWLILGQFINRLLALNVFYLSFLIIFFSTDPLDIILNCVALFFLLDIDNMVIDGDDYKKTLEWFNNKDNVKSYTHKPMNKGRIYLYFIIDLIYALLMLVTYIGIVVVPFMVAVCY